MGAGWAVTTTFGGNLEPHKYQGASRLALLVLVKYL